MIKSKVVITDSFNDETTVIDSAHLPVRVGERLRLTQSGGIVVYRVAEIEYDLTWHPASEFLEGGGIIAHQIIYVNKLR